MQQPIEPTWWRILDASLTLVSIVVTAVATGVLAWFAWEQMQIEKRRRAHAAGAANARINTIAYQLRRQIRSWVGEPGGVEVGPDGEDFEQWIRDTQNRHTFGEHLDRAEQRLDELMKSRPEATPAVGEALDRACLLFLEGTRRLNEYASTPRPGFERIFEWVQLRQDAEKDLRACVAALERGAIAGSLLEAEQRLAAERAAGSVINQIAEQFQTPKPADESSASTQPNPEAS